MNLTRIIVLAHSWKNHDWCLAGIEVTTGKWVRPVTTLEDGRIRQSDMKVGGYFPQILDILDMPLDSTGPDFDFESENRTILPGQWYRRGRAVANDLLKYVERPAHILHNRKKYVTTAEMSQKPIEKRTTLELIHVRDLAIRDTGTRRPKNTRGRAWSRQGDVIST